jgi:hypothetical protein
MPEDALELATREVCRISFAADCATFFARWRRDYPGSPRLASALTWARNLPKQDSPWSKGRRALGSFLAEAKLAALERLFGGGEEAEARSPAHARKLTMDYVRHYSYALPFDRGVVESAWQRCTAPLCATALRRAEEMLGPLDGRARRRAPARRPRDAG